MAMVERPADSKMSMKNTILVAGVLVVGAYLGGLLPSYIKAKHLERDLRLARQENRMAQLRDLAGLAYVQASQKNYGLAAGTSARFFEQAHEAAGQATDSSGRKALEDLSGPRERITLELAKGDATVLSDLEALFLKTRQTTGIPSP